MTFTFLVYIQLFKETATFKLHFVLIVLSCKQQNVTYIRFLYYMHLPLKRIILLIIKSMFTLVFCLQTIKRNEPTPHSDAFLDQQLLSLTLHGRSTAFNCAITTVQWIIIYPTVNGQSHRTIPTT